MKTIDTHGSFDDALAGSSDRVQGIARRLRELIADVYPDVVEVPWPKQRIIGYGVGPKKMSEHFCYIGAHREYANLGFYYGTDLPDPEGLMEGTGKKLRHIKVRDAEGIGQSPLRNYIQLALDERKQALGLEK
ncbi:MAG: hypothetical protein GWN58_22270 [Anaerolineae bacterium]|nr:hypothetical protein [Anaerolineae bacterium]